MSDTYPAIVKGAFFVYIATACLMILAGLIVGTAGYTGEAGVSPDVRAAVVRNQRFVAVFNIVAALVIAVLASRLKSGSSMSRKWLLGVVLVVVIADLLAFVVKAGGFAFGIIPVLLAAAGLAMYSEPANTYFRRIQEGRDE